MKVEWEYYWRIFDDQVGSIIFRVAKPPFFLGAHFCGNKGILKFNVYSRSIFVLRMSVLPFCISTKNYTVLLAYWVFSDEILFCAFAFIILKVPLKSDIFRSQKYSFYQIEGHIWTWMHIFLEYICISYLLLEAR